MRLVIADTGPINYLIIIGHIDVLAQMFERVVLPSAVQTELSSPAAPPSVQQWISSPPSWLEIVDTSGVTPFSGLHIGESAAIALAESLKADLLLIDERAGFRVAQSRGLRATGTLGVLDAAAERGLIVFSEAIAKLERTSFRKPQKVLDALLRKHAAQS